MPRRPVLGRAWLWGVAGWLSLVGCRFLGWLLSPGSALVVPRRLVVGLALWVTLSPRLAFVA